jgi:hypothetical protein
MTPFAVGVHPRSPWRDLQGLDAVGGEDRVEGAGVLRVSVTDQEAQRVDPYVQFDGQISRLLHGPGRRWMRGYAGEVQAAGAVFEEHQRVHPAQVDQVDVDEVAGDDALGWCGEELAPGRAAAAGGRIDAGRGKDLPGRGGADGMPEANELALDPPAAPARVVPGQPQHQAPSPRWRSAAGRACGGACCSPTCGRSGGGAKRAGSRVSPGTPVPTGVGVAARTAPPATAGPPGCTASGR